MCPCDQEHVNVIEGCQRISGGVSRKSLTNIRSHTIVFLYYLMAVLVAISIPIFTSQLEKARESTDASNIRAAYAEVMAEALMQNGTPASVSRVVSLKQQVNSWQTDSINFAGSGTITGGAHVDVSGADGQPTAGGKCTITYTPASGANSTATVAFAFAAS